MIWFENELTCRIGVGVGHGVGLKKVVCIERVIDYYGKITMMNR